LVKSIKSVARRGSQFYQQPLIDPQWGF